MREQSHATRCTVVEQWHPAAPAVCFRQSPAGRNGIAERDEIGHAEFWQGSGIRISVVYLDFEQLGTSTVRPALLGVLSARVARANNAGRFRAYLLDPRLAPAAVASRTCRVVDLATALEETLAQEGPIVTWSAHDLRIVKKAELPQRQVQRFESRWVPALADVRRWKSRLYPDSTLPAPANAGGHALTVYMKAIGYDVPRSPAPGHAPDWLRHVLARLEAEDGSYRALSDRAKRHWHALLEGTRHDCYGLRAVYERACRELALEKAYRQTTYGIEMDGASYPIRIGRPHGALDTALRGGRATTWTCVTAYNPQSETRPQQENRQRDAELKRYLRARTIRWHPMAGVGDAGHWAPEPGVLALGVSRARAESLGREFGQAAVVWGRVGGKAELVWCNRLSQTTRTPFASAS